jgi:hypothetical protein
MTVRWAVMFDSFFVEAGKHVNDIGAIAKQPQLIIENCFGRCFLLGPPGGYITRIPGRIEKVQLIAGRQFCTGILKGGPERRKLKNLQC